MNNLTTKIKHISDDIIVFENGYKLYSNHSQDCCEHHWLDFSNIKEEDYKDLEFDLSTDNFFNRVEDYGIELLATNNFPLRIPGYGSNNGYYSSNLDLVLETDKGTRNYDITECQVIND